MATTNTIAFGNDRSLQVRIDLRGLESALALGPESSYRQLRKFLGYVFIDHRNEWIRRKRYIYGSTKFARESSDPNSIRVHKLNEGPLVPGKNDVVYHVVPQDRAAANPAQAAAMLRSLEGFAATGSVVLPVHEFGEDIDSPELMAVPVKTRPGSPEKWRAKHPSKTLVFRPSFRGKANAMLFEVIRSKGRGRPRKDGTGEHSKIRERLRLRFILTRHLDMKPTLHMYDTWQSLEKARDTRFKAACDQILADLAKGIGRR